MVLAHSPSGALSVLGGGMRQLQGVAVNHQVLYTASAGRRSDPKSDGVVFAIPILANGTAGRAERFGASDEFKKPLGLARDRLGALYVTTKELTLATDRSKRAVAKLHPDTHVTLFGEHLAGPEGLAVDREGNLYVADGDAGRILRFAAPPPPTLTTPAFTNQTTLAASGTAQARARVDVFVGAAPTPATADASATATFSVAPRLTPSLTHPPNTFAPRHAAHAP